MKHEKFSTQTSSQNNLELRIDNFEGPLDLLLHLVKENKIEIKDIFMSQVTEQFLGYMTQLESLDVDKASEYMAIAATLLEIKSHALLPVMPDIDNDMSAELQLIRQLEEYKIFREVVSSLKTQQNVDRYYREPEKLEPIDVLVLKNNFNLSGFNDALNKFLLRMQTKMIDEKTSQSIERAHFTVVDRVKHLINTLKKSQKVSFFSLFNNQSTKEEVVTTFIAVLEMLRLQQISITQTGNYEDFVISPKGNIDEIVEETSYDTLG